MSGTSGSGESGRGYAFEGFRLDLHARQVFGPDAAPVPLTAKALDVLVYLIEHRDRVVDKDELLAQVWAGRVVEENNLTQAVSALRHAFGAGVGDRRYIVTVPGHGYRFVAEVAAIDGGATEPPRRAISAAAGWRRKAAFAGLAFALLLPAFAIWWSRPARSPPLATNDAALAVLPFRSVSPGPRDELLELGMAETLIVQFSQTAGLRVRSLAATQRFAGPGRDPVDAGRQLGTAYVVEGSIQRRGDRVRVNARLLSVPDGRTLWAGTFDEHRDRVFTLQDAIAAELSAALALKMREAARYRSPCDGENVEAYRAYLAGRYVLSRPDTGQWSEAIAALQRAVALDPSCARAYAGLARIYVSQAYGADADPREVFPLARAALAQAQALDPASAESYLAKGHIAAWSDWNWARAAEAYRRAIALAPDSGDAHLAYGLALNSLGREDEGRVHMQRAGELDPLSPGVLLNQAAYLSDTQPEAAQLLLARLLQLEPGYWSALFERGRWAMQQGRMRAAIADFEQAAERSNRHSLVVAYLAKAYVDIGERDRAQALLRELEVRQRDGYVPATALARIHVALGNTDAALDQLERAYAERDVRMAVFTASRSLESLRAHPRFIALVQRMEAQGGQVAMTPSCAVASDAAVSAGCDGDRAVSADADPRPAPPIRGR